MQSKVVRVAGDVWAELQRRAVPLEDDLNSVLRRVLDIQTPGRADNIFSEDPEMDDRLIKLLRLVASRIGQEPTVSATTRTRLYKFLSERETIAVPKTTGSKQMAQMGDL